MTTSKICKIVIEVELETQNWDSQFKATATMWDKTFHKSGLSIDTGSAFNLEKGGMSREDALDYVIRLSLNQMFYALVKDFVEVIVNEQKAKE